MFEKMKKKSEGKARKEVWEDKRERCEVGEGRSTCGQRMGN